MYFRFQIVFDMRRFLVLTTVLFFCFDLTAQQDTLLHENFNECALSNGWSVSIDGNQDAVWYIGTPKNPESDSSTIDGTCMLIVDDDATGNNTPAFIWTMKSPFFETGKHLTTQFTADVHMRNAGETFRILLSDGNQQIELQKFEGRNYSGTQFSQFVKVAVDLSFFPAGRYQLVFEYNDNNQWAWWAGVDNVLVTGYGEGTILMTETFNDCALPDGWYGYVESGDHNWEIAINRNPKAGANTSLNGTCFIHFDDDIIENTAAPSKTVMVSKAFDGTQFAFYELSFDLIYRIYANNEYLEIGVLNETGFHPIQTFTTDVGGPGFNNFRKIYLDLSAFKSQENRIYFRYDDGSNWNWWIGIDNVKLTGVGSVNDFCAKAIPIESFDEKIAFDNVNAYASQDIPYQCNAAPSSALWYSIRVEESGIFEIRTETKSNDYIEVFRGEDCTSLQPVQCINRDEYGFFGEGLSLDLEPGQYFIRLSSSLSDFGNDKGQGFLTIKRKDKLPEVTSLEKCEGAALLKGGEPCQKIQNIGSEFPEIRPSDNLRSRADVWYKFVPENEGNYLFQAAADFSEVVTLYSGSCGDWTQLATNFSGGKTTLANLKANTEYLIQVTGYFATLEGSLCPSIEAIPTEVLHDCASPIALTIDGACQQSSNWSLGRSSVDTPCDPIAEADVWFEFEVTESQAYYLDFKSDFLANITVWEGSCADLRPMECISKFKPCEDMIRLPWMEAGKKYFIQISSRSRVSDQNRGSFCLEVISPSRYTPRMPLALDIEQTCISKDVVSITPVASGGAGDYSFYLPQDEILTSNQPFIATVIDANGCISQYEGTTPDCSETACQNNASITASDLLCPDSNEGFIQITPGIGLPPFSVFMNGDVADFSNENLAPGTYDILITDQAGCQQTATIQLEASAPIVANVEVINADHDLLGSIDLNLTGGTAPYQIQWSIEGDTILAPSPLLTGQAGNYYVTVTDALGCTLELGPIFLDATTSSVELEQGTVSIYPNPTKDFITVRIQLEDQQKASYKIFTTSGVQVGNGPIHTISAGAPVHILLDHLPSGAYLLEIKTEKGQKLVSRFIKI